MLLRPSRTRPAWCRSRCGCSGSARWCGGVCWCRAPAPCASCTACSRWRWAGKASTSTSSASDHRYGAWEASASSPDIALATLRLRKGTRFAYDYDLNIPWRHEVRIEDHRPAEPGKGNPRCIAGNGACPPEDCGGPRGYLTSLDEASSLGALEVRGINTNPCHGPISSFGGGCSVVARRVDNWA